MKQGWKVMMVLMLISGVAQAGYVTINNLGNAAESTTYGAVNYRYNIGQYEVTIDEWQVFANATGVGNGNENYWNDGIRMVGTAAPATHVSLDEARQYCNWLTSGSSTSGAYVYSSGVYQSTDRASASSTYGTIYAVPTEDEWYKAAYYTGVGSTYSYYSDGTDVLPSNGAGNWNYNNSAGTPWIAGTGATEQNGTEDMMGNVWEWTEDGWNRGQNYTITDGAYMRKDLSGADYPDDTQVYYIGFRVVEIVPEPATVYVTIDNPGNVADVTGYGAVSSKYNISKYEVSIAKWEVFAVATGVGSGNEEYWDDGTRTVGRDAPATYVSLDEARQYCNWLTSGSTANGAYLYSSGVYHSTDRASARSTYGTIYAIPTEDEWYKAAYYTGSDYSSFADGHPYNQPEIGVGYWNYATNTVWEAGTGGTEQNGTEDMMGNVAEWMEDATGRMRGNNYTLASPNYAYMRNNLSGSFAAPTTHAYYIGFRTVEIVPGLATMSLLVLSGLVSLLFRITRR